jgi:hypothetical protein
LTSKRKRKKAAVSLGLTERELALVEILEEVLEALRWSQILGYSNQFLINHQLDVSKPDRDHILAAATRTVDRDRKLHEWRARLAGLKDKIHRVEDGISDAAAADAD